MSEQEYWKRNYSFALEACNNEVKARRRAERERDEARRWGEHMRDKLALETNDGDRYIAPWEQNNESPD